MKKIASWMKASRKSCALLFMSLGMCSAAFPVEKNGLAEAAGLHVNHISFIERAKTSASLQALESISKALNVKPSDLILSAEALLEQAP